MRKRANAELWGCRRAMLRHRKTPPPKPAFLSWPCWPGGGGCGGAGDGGGDGCC